MQFKHFVVYLCWLAAYLFSCKYHICRMIRAKLLCCVIAVAAMLAATKPLGIHQYKVETIVLDAGHGGKDPGTHGKTTKEKDLALDMVKELGSILKANMPGVKIIYTRKTDVFVELHERAEIANRNHADLFISIHCNSGHKSVFGTETYVMGLHTSDQHLQVAKRENAVILQEDNYLDKYDGFNPKSPLAHVYFSNFQNAHQANSLSLAEKIEKQFETKVGRQSRGVKQAGFLVLWRTAMPSVLVESGYLTHKKDENYLATKEGREYMASAIYRAVKEYKKEIEEAN